MEKRSTGISLRSAVMAVVLLAVIPALGLILWHGIRRMDEAKGWAQSKALDLARDIAAEQNSISISTKRILQTLTLTQEIQNHEAEQSTRLLVSIQKEYGAPYLNFVAINMDGQAFAQSLTSEPLKNYADRNWFKNLKLSGEFTTSEFIVGKTTKVPIMALAYPVVSKDGKMHAALASGVGLSWLGEQLAASMLPPNSIVTIIDHLGTVLAREPPLPDTVGTRKGETRVIELAHKQAEGTLEITTTDGVERILAFTRMYPDMVHSPAIYVGIDKKVAYADAWRALYIQFAWLVGLGILGLTAARLSGGRFLATPAQNIAAAAEHIGAGNLSERLNEKYLVLEYSQISQAFNTMATLLEARAIELELNAQVLSRSNQELEQEVATRKQAQASLTLHAAKLKRSNEELEQFAYVASHDLQEPLRIIYSYLQLIERRYQPIIDEDGKRFITATMDATERMRSLIRGLLDYSRVSTKAQPFAPVDTGEVIQEVLALLSETIAESKAVVTAEELPRIMGDRVQVLQLLQNLVSNALKFHAPGQIPEVSILAAREGGFWNFTVRDNGIGIESDYFDRIFAMFQRLHTRAQFTGTGIGLTLCRKIVERHNGRIWVESEPGNGSAFHFTLPALEEAS